MTISGFLKEDIIIFLTLNKALQSTNRYQENKPLGDLDGIPIVLKDQIKVTGLTVRYGMPFPDHNPCTEDAAVVERLRNHGMIIIGLVNMHQAGDHIFTTIFFNTCFLKVNFLTQQKSAKNKISRETFVLKNPKILC